MERLASAIGGESVRALPSSKYLCEPVYEAGGVGPEGKQAMTKFYADYKKKFGIDVQLYAPYVYDAVMVMVTAMEKCKSADPKVYLPCLQKTDYKGVTGPISFDEKGDIKNGALTLYTYKDGKKSQIAVVH